jgi:GMP synthase-like glutamine amidotransferase
MLVLQPSASAPLARLGDWLRAAGAELEVVDPADGSVPATADGFDGVVCLGGPMGAREDMQHAWLSDVRALLADTARRRLPVLGICLGAQLLAVATGGTVRRSPGGPEVGTLLIAKRDAAALDPLFAELPFTPDVMQFHVDEVDLLPPGAELLASSPRYPNQAFRVGECAYALQFHIESSPEIVLEWAREDPESAAFAPPGQFEVGHLVAFHEDIAETWRPFAERFVQLAAGKLAPAVRPSRQLPII